MQWIFGKTGYSFIDVWSLAHLGFWVFVGSTFWALRASLTLALVCCMSAAFAWEIFEYFAQRKWTHIWLTPESWWNSWVSDPLTCLVGVAGMYLLLNRHGGRS